MNPYHVLGVPPHADNATLQAAYRKLVRLHHPDLVVDEAARRAASERMVEINWAWHIVSNSSRRAAFDAQLHAQQREVAHRQQEAFRAQAQGQVVRGKQAHLNDVLKAQALRRQQQNQQWAQERAQQHAQSQETTREQAFLEWQVMERARLERDEQSMSALTRPARKRLMRQEKKRQALARARLQRIRREDRRRSSAPPARRQLAEAALLFEQEGRTDEAIALCQDILRVDGRNVRARELLGDFHLRLGREDRALPLWEQVLLLQPQNASVRRKLRALHSHNCGASEPRRPRAAVRRARAEARLIQTSASFWCRLRDAFSSGL